MNSVSTLTDDHSASTRLSVRQSADPRLVVADRVRQLYSQMPMAIGSTVAVSVLAAYELREGRYVEILWFWGGLVTMLTLMRIVLYAGYRRSRDKVGEAEQWLRWLGISALAAGATWGFAAAVFFPAHVDQQQVFIAFLLAVMVGGGVAIYAVSWPIYALYAAGILFPFTYVLATFGNRLFAEIAFIVPVFYVVNVAVAYRLNHVFYSGYRLRHAYSKLADDYSALNERLEHQLEDLLQAQREVEASGRKLALFAERAPIGVLEVDIRATVIEANPATENLFGYPATELIGRSVIEMLCPPNSPTLNGSAWEAFVASAGPMTLPQVACVRRDGIEVICEFTLIPLVNEDGEILSVIAQVRDITQAIEIDKMKKEFTSTLSHELRTPLTSIIGSLQLINSGVLGNIEADMLELTTIAERNGQRLLDLINDILDIEKIEWGKLALYFEDVTLQSLVDEALVLNRSFAERFKVRLEVGARADDVLVSVDRKRLLQVLTNLISNAAKFSPENGAVEIHLTVKDGCARVAVGDRGPGIPEQFRARIFSRFAQADSALTRQKGGTGLGLAICKRLVEAMSGQIGFEDREGGGTFFFFELPLKSKSA